MKRAEAIVDLGAVARNCARLRNELTGGTSLCAVMKADGYGHGAVPCARAALRGGAEVLGVAAAAEATELRGALPDVPIFMMGALSYTLAGTDALKLIAELAPGEGGANDELLLQRLAPFLLAGLTSPRPLNDADRSLDVSLGARGTATMRSSGSIPC